MEQTQRTRLVILAVAGVMFGGGVYGWVWYNNQKSQDADLEPMPMTHAHLPMRKKLDPLASASSGPTRGLMASTGAPTGALPQTLPGTVKPAGTLPGTVAGATTGAAATSSIKSTTNAALPVAANKSGILPGAQTAPVTPAVTAAAPAGQNASKPVLKPSLTATSAAAGADTKPAQNAAPKISSSTRPVAVPAATSMPVLKPQPAAPVAAAPTLIPHKLGATAPATATATAAPASSNPASVTGTEVAAGANPAASGAGMVLATTATQAAADAKAHVGRFDPTQPITAFLPFPHRKGGSGGNDLIPPPPPLGDQDASSAKAGKHAVGPGALGKIKEKLVPPPPPVEATANNGGGLGAGGVLGIEELPVPPSKPIIGDQMKIIAVMDDKAVVSFPSTLRTKNKWPKYMTLSSGQQFESITLVSIGKDGVTIEEDGERSLKPIPNVK